MIAVVRSSGKTAADVPLTRLKVRGPYKGPSGYEHHVREFVRAMHGQGVALELVDLPEWGGAKLPHHLRDPWFDTLDRPVDAPVTLHFTMPHQVAPEPGRANVNYTMFEAARIPDRWVEHRRRHDLVVVPTESSRRACVDSGVPERQVRLCPLGINARAFGADVAPLPLRLGTGQPVADFRSRFLNVSELGPRKNLAGLLRAWLRATETGDDAVLVMKVGCYAPGWYEEFLDLVARLERQVGKLWSEAAPTHFIFDLFADDEMPRLFAAATHYVSLSHGEGWDQAMVEAAATGLRLIAPNHSAYPTYLDDSVATLIPSREVPARFPGGGPVGALFAGLSWWEPDEGAASQAIRDAIAGRDSHKTSARPRLLAEFTWERAAQRLLEVLEEVAQRHGKRRLWPRLRWRCGA